MTETSMPDFLSQMVADAANAPDFAPHAFYNVDGDCIEFLASNESYFSERVDSRLTVFYGQESHELVGSLIKGIKCILRDLSKSCPGFRIEVIDGRICLSHLITATLWSVAADSATTRGVVYKKLRSIAEEQKIEVDVPELASC